MAKTVTGGRRPDTTAGTDAIYRRLFDSFNPDSGGRISPLEVLSRLERAGLRPDDPRIAEALTGLVGAEGGSRQITFTQFKSLAQHNSSLIRRAVEGNLAVPDFAALRRMRQRPAAAWPGRPGARAPPASAPDPGCGPRRIQRRRPQRPARYAAADDRGEPAGLLAAQG